MAFEVPYVVHGAMHSARLFRRQYQASVGPGSGVTRPGDFKVLPLSTPGDGVRVLSGGGTAQSRDTSATERESYAVENASQETVTGLAGTGTGETRRDMVIIEITDPSMTSVSYPDPAGASGTWTDGSDFARVTVIQNVGSATRLEDVSLSAWRYVTGITLATIDYPASTSTISEGMITDRREVQKPERGSQKVTLELSGSTTYPVVSTSAYPGGSTWPSTATADPKLSIRIPADATVAKITGTWFQVISPGAGNSYGSVWVQLAPSSDPDSVVTSRARWSVDGSATDGSRASCGLAAVVDIPEGLRGETVQFIPRACRDYGAESQALTLDQYSSFSLEVLFEAAAE